MLTNNLTIKSWSEEDRPREKLTLRGKGALTDAELFALLQEMIAFALVDGELHDREYDFLEIVSKELEIEKETFLKLFENRGETIVIKDEFNRICQFYRLALLMHCE